MKNDIIFNFLLKLGVIYMASPVHSSNTARNQVAAVRPTLPGPFNIPIALVFHMFSFLNVHNVLKMVYSCRNFSANENLPQKELLRRNPHLISELVEFSLGERFAHLLNPPFLNWKPRVYEIWTEMVKDPSLLARVQTLSLKNLIYQYKTELLSQYLPHLTNVRHLTVFIPTDNMDRLKSCNAIALRFLGQMTQLQRLDLTSFSGDNFHFIAKTQINELRVESCTGSVVQKEIPKSAPLYESLTKLRMRTGDPLPLDHFTSLSELILINVCNKEISNDIVKLKSAKALERLALHSTERGSIILNQAALDVLVNLSHYRLKCIEFSNGLGIHAHQMLDDAYFSCIAQLRNLKGVLCIQSLPKGHLDLSAFGFPKLNPDLFFDRIKQLLTLNPQLEGVLCNVGVAPEDRKLVSEKIKAINAQARPKVLT